MLYLSQNGEKIGIGEEITIETDGKRLHIESDNFVLDKEYKSPLEILHIMMFFMKHTKKTTLHFEDGTAEFVRTKKYGGCSELKL